MLIEHSKDNSQKSVGYSAKYAKKDYFIMSIIKTKTITTTVPRILCYYVGTAILDSTTPNDFHCN